MEPISTTLAGIALVQKSVEFIKSNINTANDIKDIASAIDGMFAGEKQIQQKKRSRISEENVNKSNEAVSNSNTCERDTLQEMHYSSR